jgi:antagonist of KipI
MSRIHVIKPGLLTTVQDLGRPGSQRYGVTPGGAADAGALRLANLLVGNPEGAAGLEITLTGPTLQFAEEALVAICSGEFEVTIAGRSLPMWRPVWLKAGLPRRRRWIRGAPGARRTRHLSGGGIWRV